MLLLGYSFFIIFFEAAHDEALDFGRNNCTFAVSCGLFKRRVFTLTVLLDRFVSRGF